MLLGAWEAGLDGVSEESAKLLLLSLQVMIANWFHKKMINRINYPGKR